MRLSEDLVAIRAAARRFAEEQLAPNAEDWDRHGSCPADVMRQLAEVGLVGTLVSAERGGVGAGHLANVVAMEEIAAACGGVSTMLHVHNFQTLAMAERGSDAQRARWLPGMLDGSIVGAFCLTEPQAGSDTSMSRTRAERVDGGWALTGTKSYITNGARAGIATVVAVTDPAAGRRGISAFLVPTTAPGWTVSRVEEKLGQRCSDTAEIVLDRCVVSDENVFGPLNGAYGQAMASLAAGRIGVAAQAVGMARAAYAHALAFARERRAFGKPIVEHQVIGFKLADMLARIEMARQYTYHVAGLLQEGAPAVTQASIAKCHAAEMAESVASDAISILGGYGYMRGSVVERIYRDVRVCQIYEGTAEMQRMIVSRGLDLAQDG